MHHKKHFSFSRYRFPYSIPWTQDQGIAIPKILKLTKKTENLNQKNKACLKKLLNAAKIHTFFTLNRIVMTT